MSRIPIRAVSENNVPIDQYSLGDRCNLVVAGHNPVEGIATDLSKVLKQSGEESFLANGQHLCILDCGGVNLSAIKSKEELFTAFMIKNQNSEPGSGTESRRTQDDGEGLALIIYKLQQSHIQAPIMKQLFTKSLLPLAVLIVCIDYNLVETLATMLESYELFTATGIDSTDVPDYMQWVAKERKIVNIDRLLDYIKADLSLLDLCRNPECTNHILAIYSEDKYQCPTTRTALYKSLTERIIRKHLKAASAVDIYHLDDEDDEHFRTVCKVAYLLLHKKRKYFTKAEFSTLCLTQRLPGSGVYVGMGLMQTLVHKSQYSFQFLHDSIQDFLASWYISQQPYYDQAYIVLDSLAPSLLLENRFGRVLRFLFGLSNFHTANKLPLNVSKIVLVPLIDSITAAISLEDDPTIAKLQLILACLHETQDPNIVKKFVTKRQSILNLHFEDSKQFEANLEVLAFIIAHSDLNQWSVEVPFENKHIGDFLAMLVSDQLHSSSEPTSKVKLHVVDGVTYRVSPLYPKTITPLKLKVNIYCRLTRELLHRFSQYYSPIKLKSDGSNPAYVSILACSCLKSAMETKLFLQFEPVVALHWLPVSNTSRSASRSQEEAPQNHLHMQREHNGQYTELVIMMTPFLNRLKFILPGTKQEVSIELCNNDSPDFLWSGIETNVNQDVTLAHAFSESDVGTCQMIVPSLPLPPQAHSHSQILTSNMHEPLRESLPIARRHSPNRLEAMATLPTSTFTDGTMGNRQEYQAIQSRQQDWMGSVVGSPFNYGSTFSVAQPLRHSIFKPGVIVHSVIPEVFACDMQYPLPDELHLVRKGGNGEIYLGTFSSRELIVKKTAYRSREVMIHSKLNHNNIVKLLCVMIGEKSQTQRRKWNSYHFLARATGDLARLLIDDKNNTLKNLKQKHGDDPRRFGIIHGNLKYSLTQILKGLVYLHELDIVHRDLKASNILIYFHCSCSNLLNCTCANKYGIQITDFDSAIELTDGHLPATKWGQNRETFTIVPVGTNGYRPPESSMHVVSNDIALISPKLTKLADMWSFGVLMLKMAVGEYGPTSQKEVCNLKHVCVQVRSPNFLYV